MNAAEMVLMTVSGGFGFVLADGLDRFMATYNPSGATKPTDKFTSDGTGTLANTLNIAAMPDWKRAAVGVGVVAAPAVGAMFIKNPYARASLEGMAIGSGISAFKTLWNNVIMPMLIGKDTTVPTLQKSYIARLYPAEVASHINAAAHKSGGSAAGMLSAPPGDVGPFALSGDSPYPDAHEALGYRTGVHEESAYPDTAQALRHNAGLSGDSPYASAQQALRAQTGMSAPLPTGGPPAYMPGPPPGAGPGPQTKTDCGCVGDEFAGFLGGAPEEEQMYPTN